jgi:hypothetical protein
LVRTFAIDAIKPKASRGTERLEASSSVYKMAVSNFWMDGNWRMGRSFNHYLAVKQ